MSANLKPYQNLLHVYDKAHNLFIFVWSDPKGTDGVGKYQLYYEVVGRIEDFDPEKKSPILVTKLDEAGTLLASPIPAYGLVSGISFVGGRLEVKIANLTVCATSSEANKVAGDRLVGVYKDAVTFSGAGVGDWFLWQLVVVESATHTGKQPILEVCENKENDPVFPGGTICVQYQRDTTGSIKVDASGAPLIALVDKAKPSDPDNLKIGRLVLGFQKDFFGPGQHGWVGQGGEATDFDVYHEPSDEPFNTVRVKRGTLFTASGLFFDIFDPDNGGPVTVCNNSYVWLEISDDFVDAPTFSVGQGTSVNNPIRPSIVRYPLARISITGTSMTITKIRPLNFNQANIKAAFGGKVSIKVGGQEYTDGEASLYSVWR